jgi:23S rRNA (uracil1939-C5)-methyltransferase
MTPEELRVEYIGTEGDGVGHLANGAAVYLPGTLPGELVLAHPTQKRGDGWAATAELLSTSDDRAAPPCQHFATCGGCALQHWSDGAYLAWKTSLLATALQRAGYSQAPSPTIRTPPAARRRIDLAVQRKGPDLLLGLHARRSAEIVDLQACPVLHPTLLALIAPLRTMLRGLNGLRRTGSVILNLLDSGPDLLLRLDAPLSTPDRTKLAAFATAHAAAALSPSLSPGTPASPPSRATPRPMPPCATPPTPRGSPAASKLHAATSPASRSRPRNSPPSPPWCSTRRITAPSPRPH